MTILEAIEARHSVRQYQNRPLAQEVIAALEDEIALCTAQSGLHIQLVTDEPKAFGGMMSRNFVGVTSYLALVGKKGDGLEEACGWYGERLVLKAQQLGLNSCWVALTFHKVKGAFAVGPDEKLCLVVALGYGKTQGLPHQSKPLAEVAGCEGPMPDWFRRGVEAALLAPTAINQQKFRFELRDGRVTAKALAGPCTGIDLGIVKYHFEAAAGKENFAWG